MYQRLHEEREMEGPMNNRDEELLTVYHNLSTWARMEAYYGRAVPKCDLGHFRMRFSQTGESRFDPQTKFAIWTLLAYAAETGRWPALDCETAVAADIPSGYRP